MACLLLLFLDKSKLPTDTHKKSLAAMKPSDIVSSSAPQIDDKTPTQDEREDVSTKSESSSVVASTHKDVSLIESSSSRRIIVVQSSKKG
jgi:hypothetical protein